MACIDRNAKGIALVVDNEGYLIATVTDGDIRRAVLAGIDLDQSIQELLKQRESKSRIQAITAPVETSDVELIRLMNEHSIRHIPLLDGSRRVVDVVLLSELIKEYDLPLSAVVMAGGYGTRLHPLTESVPKPMLPVGDRPLLELVIEQLRQAGIRRVNLTTHYKGDIISEHFGDGKDFGMEISYVKEDHPLGTAGALSLLDTSDVPLLVINGDILTQIDFRAMLNFHWEHEADMTVGVKQYEFRVPYGVIETDGVAVIGISEKPLVQHFINAGIYLINPEVCRYVPTGQPFDIPDLISQLVADGRLVISFPIVEYWLDIGSDVDYEEAQKAVESKKIKTFQQGD
jgi:dTDP-glucose pyrophosphorylase